MLRFTEEELRPSYVGTMLKLVEHSSRIELAFYEVKNHFVSQEIYRLL